MPRASNGTYSLPAGNPVVTATTITSTWANTTLTDIANAMTDSLSRNGEGAMLAPLEVVDGTSGAPGISWATDPNSGLYKAGTGDYRFSVGGTDRFQVTATGVKAGDGNVASVGLGFISDPDVGLYRIGANQLGIGVSGQLGIVTSQQWQFFGGAVGTPGISFITDGDTGIYSVSANVLGFATAGVQAAFIDSTGILNLNNNLDFFKAGTMQINARGGAFDFEIVGRNAATNLNFYSGNGAFAHRYSATTQSGLAVAGSVGNPAYSFLGDPDTGLYNIGANTLGITAGGVFACEFQLNSGACQTYFPDGSVTLPVISFATDADTGFYRDTSNQIAIALGGVTAGQIAQGSFTGTLTGYASGPTGTVKYIRLGKKVTIWTTADISGTSNAGSFTMTGLPSIIRPSTTVSVPSTNLLDGATAGSSPVIGDATISSSGIVTFGRGTSSGGTLITSNTGWSSSGTKGLLSGWSITYPVD